MTAPAPTRQAGRGEQWSKLGVLGASNFNQYNSSYQPAFPHFNARKMPSPARESSSRPQRDSPPPRRRSRSRSRSPRHDAVGSEDVRKRMRSRSRSPPRMPREKNFSGLKWKKHDIRDSDRDRDDRRGGYGRDRYEEDRRRGYRRDEPRRAGYEGRGRDEDFRDRQRRGDRDRYAESRYGGRDDRGGRDGDDRRERDRPREDRERKPKEEKPKPMAAPVAPGQEMIIVTVNDRESPSSL